ncbi:ABC transporter permease [Pseudonocardia kongjuensis]|uniref:ABC transporter permease n=1 Tax=Pseudonocardia kongjuensis TaxID=102227 RepID=A0ABP4I969_9PSEU
MSAGRGTGFAVAVATLALAATVAVAPGLFTSRDPLHGELADRLRPPDLRHPFGTDELGRDVLARVLHGAGLSLTAVVIAVGTALVVGVLVGVVAGSGPRRLDDVLMRGVEVVLAVPSLLLVLSLVAVLGPGTVNIALAVGLTSAAGFARVMRTEAVRVRRLDYVDAARSSGTRRAAVITRHVLPNSVRPVLALATVELGNAVLTVAALGYLGYGNPPPTPEWGSLIAAGQDYLASAWWLTVLPGLAVVAVVLAANHIGHHLRER